MFKYSTYLFLLVTMLVGVQSCARRPAIPDQSTIPTSRQLPLDGLWRLTSGKASSIFRIDKGRMYFFERRKPLPKNSPQRMGATAKDPKVRSAADLSRRPGNMIVKDIKETGDPLIYTCQSLSYDVRRRMYGFGAAEIKIASSTQIILKTFPNLGTGLGQKIEESFWRENLVNQSWFEQTLLAADNRDFRSSKDSWGKAEQPAQSSESSSAIKNHSNGTPSLKRKVLTVPLEKMESNGKLSKSAKDFIEQAVQNAKEANGYVKINYPPNAPDAVVRSLVNIGVETYVDDNRNDYELVIFKP